MTPKSVSRSPTDSSPRDRNTLWPARVLRPCTRQINHALAKCGHFTVASGGQTINGTVGAMSFPQQGAQSNAYAVNITVQGVNAGADLVLFRVGSMLGEVIYEDLGTPTSNRCRRT